MNKMGVIGAVLGFGAIAAIAFMGGQQTADETAKAEATIVQTYNLNAAQLDFSRACVSTLKDSSLKFTGGSNAHSGCGCMADQMGSRTRPSDFAVHARVLKVFAKAERRTDFDFVAEFGETATELGVSPAKIDISASAINAAAAKCGQMERTEADRIEKMPEAEKVALEAKKQSRIKAETDRCTEMREGMTDSQKAKLEQSAKARGKTFNWSTCKME